MGSEMCIRDRLFTFSHNVSSTLLLCHRDTSAHCRPPPDYWYTYFLFLADPDPLQEIAVSAFSRSPLGRAHTFSSRYIIPQNVLPLSPFLTLAFPFFLSFLLLLSCTPKLLHGQYFFLFSSYLLPFFIDYVILPCPSSPFRYFLP